MKYLTALLLTLSLVAFTGCKTSTTQGPNGPVTTNTLDTNAVITAIDTVVPGAVRYACSKDTNARPYFIQAAVVIRAAASNGQFDSASISNSLSKISIRELRSQQAIDAENAAFGIYQLFLGQVVTEQLAKTTWLPPVLNAIAEALLAGTQ